MDTKKRSTPGDRPSLKEHLIFRVMGGMSRWTFLPGGVRARFGRSASKRDPRRLQVARPETRDDGRLRREHDKLRKEHDRVRRNHAALRKERDKLRKERDKVRGKLDKLRAERDAEKAKASGERVDTVHVSREMRHFQDHQFDPEWYAERHGLETPQAAWSHFLDEGSRRYFAPRAELTQGEGPELSQWGAEYVLRSGIPVGGRGDMALFPGDPSAKRAFSLSNPDGKRIAVVSAIFGEYDRLLPVDPSWTAEADFFVFTDRRFETRTAWQPVHANYFHSDPRRRARFVKTHLPTYFSEYDRVMWVDGNVLLCAEPGRIIDAYGLDGVDFAAFRHHQRSTLVAEAQACARLGKEDPRFILSHLKGNAEHPGFREPVLFETMAMVMSPKAPPARDLSRRWWRYILQGSKRDQLSLPLAVADTADLAWSYFADDTISKSPYFLRVSH